MKINQNNIGLFIESKEVVDLLKKRFQAMLDEVRDERVKLGKGLFDEKEMSIGSIEEMEFKAGVAKQSLMSNLQTDNIDANNVRRLFITENTFSDIKKVSVGLDTDFNLFNKLPDRKDTYIYHDEKICVRYIKRGPFIACIIFLLYREKCERYSKKGPFEENTGVVSWIPLFIDTIDNHFVIGERETFGLLEDTKGLLGEKNKIHLFEEPTERDLLDETKNFLDDFLKTLAFVELGEIDLKILSPSQSMGTKKKGKFKNDTNRQVIVVDSTWNTTIVRTTGFNVSGHFRLQRCGKNFSGVKLTWINSYDKKGYVRKAKKLHED